MLGGSPNYIVIFTSCCAASYHCQEKVFAPSDVAVSARRRFFLLHHLRPLFRRSIAPADGRESDFSSFFTPHLQPRPTRSKRSFIFFFRAMVRSTYIYIYMRPLVRILNFNVRFLTNDAVASIPSQTELKDLCRSARARGW